MIPPASRASHVQLGVLSGSGGGGIVAGMVGVGTTAVAVASTTLSKASTKRGRSWSVAL